MNAAALRDQQDGVPPPNSLAYHSRARVLLIPAEMCLLLAQSGTTSTAQTPAVVGSLQLSRPPLGKSPLVSPNLKASSGGTADTILIRQSGFEKRLHAAMVARHIVPMNRLQNAFPSASENYRENADLNMSFELALNMIPSRWKNLRIHERPTAVVVVLNCNYLDCASTQSTNSRVKSSSTRLAPPTQTSAFEEVANTSSVSNSIPGGIRWPDAVRCVTAVKSLFRTYFESVPCRCVVVDSPSAVRSLLTQTIFISVSSKTNIDAFASWLVGDIAKSVVQSLHAQVLSLAASSSDPSDYATPLDDPDVLAAQSTLFNTNDSTITSTTTGSKPLQTAPIITTTPPTPTSNSSTPNPATNTSKNGTGSTGVAQPSASNTNRSSTTSNSTGNAASAEAARRINISARIVKQRADLLLQLGAADTALQLHGTTTFAADPLWLAALLNSIAAARYAQNKVFLAFIPDASRIFNVFSSDATRWGSDLAPLVQAIDTVVGSSTAALKRSVAGMRSSAVTSSVKQRLVKDIDTPSQEMWTELQAQLAILKEGTSSSSSPAAPGTIDYELQDRLLTASTKAKRCFEVIAKLVFAELDIYLSEALHQLRAIPRQLYDLTTKIQLEQVVLYAFQHQKQKFLSAFLALNATVRKLSENEARAALRYIPLLCNACGCRRKAALFMIESAIAERHARNYEEAVALLVHTALLIGVPLDIPQLLSVIGLPFPPPARCTLDSGGKLVSSKNLTDACQKDFLYALGERGFTSFPAIQTARRKLDECDTAAASKRQAEQRNASASNDTTCAIQGSENGSGLILQSSHVNVLVELLGVLTDANWDTDGVRCHLASLLLFSYPSYLDSNMQQELVRIMEQDAPLLLPHVPPVHRLPSIFTNVDVLPLPPHLAPKVVQLGGALFLYIDRERLKMTVLSMNGRRLDDSVVWCAGEVGTVRVTVANPLLNYLQITSIALLCRNVEVPLEDAAHASLGENADAEKSPDEKNDAAKDPAKEISSLSNDPNANTTFFIGGDDDADEKKIVSRRPSEQNFRDGENDISSRLTPQSSVAISNDVENSDSDTESDADDGAVDTSNYYGCITSYSSTREDTPISYLTKGIVLKPQATTQLSLFVEPRKEGFLSIDGIEVRVGQMSQCAPAIVRFSKPHIIPVMRKLPTVECIMSCSDVEIFGGQTFHISARLTNNSMVPINKMRFSVHISTCELSGCDGCLEGVSTKAMYARVEQVSGDGSENPATASSAGAADGETDIAASTSPSPPAIPPWRKDEKDTHVLYAFQPYATATFDVTLTAPVSVDKIVPSFILFRVDYGVEYEKPKAPPGVGPSIPVFTVVPLRSLNTKVRLFHLPSLEISSLSLSNDRRFVEVRVKNKNPRHTIVLFTGSVLSFAGIRDTSLVSRTEYLLPPIEISKIPEGKRSFSIPWALRDSPKCRGTVTLDLSKLQNEVVYADPLEDAVVFVACELDGILIHNWINTNPPLFPLCFPAVRPVQVTVMITAPWRTAIPLRVRVSTDPLADVSMIAGPTDTTVVVGQDDADYREVFELIAFKTGEHVITVILSDSKQREITHTIRLQVEHTQT